MIRYLLIISILFTEHTAPAASRGLKSKKNAKKTGVARRTPKIKEKRSTLTKPKLENPIRLGIGAGIQSVYLPSLGFDAFLVKNQFQVGAEVGFFQLSQAEFSGSTSFVGVSGRWQPNLNRPWFIGISFGSRNIKLTTNADLTYTDASIGNTTTTSIAWTRKVSQTLFYPKVGWHWLSKRSSILAAAGLMVPLGSKASITGNPPSAEGISDEDYQVTAESKLKDVTKTTNAVLPGLELKYFYFFN
jgi:hypothetical protein